MTHASIIASVNQPANAFTPIPTLALVLLATLLKTLSPIPILFATLLMLSATRPILIFPLDELSYNTILVPSKYNLPAPLLTSKRKGSPLPPYKASLYALYSLYLVSIAPPRLPLLIPAGANHSAAT